MFIDSRADRAAENAANGQALSHRAEVRWKELVTFHAGCCDMADAYHAREQSDKPTGRFAASPSNPVSVLVRSSVRACAA